MDVRCDRCQTEYELDETRLTEAGVAVKCTNCGNVFKVRMRTTSLPGIPMPSPPSLNPPPALGAPHRAWLVRRYDGSTLSLNDLTELQRAVIERQVAPDDGVSIGGGAWHTLGSIPELASFFEVVRASRSRSSSSIALSADVAPSLQPGGRSLTPVWQEGPSAIGNVGAHGAEPAWVSRSALPDPEVAAMLEQEDKQVLRKSRVSAWAGGLVVVAVVAAAIAVYTVGIPGMSAPGTVAVPPVKPPDVNAPVRPPAVPSLAPEETHAAPAPTPVVAPPAAGPAGSTPAGSPPKVEPKTAPAKPEAGPKKAAAPSGASDEAPAGRGFDYYIAQGHKLLDSKPSQALSMFDKAAEQDPKSPEPDSGRGLAYANMERLTDASASFQAALRKSSEFTEAILGLAEVSARQGNKRKAIGLYQRYLDLTPDGPDAPAARAQLDELKAEAPAPAAAATQAAASPAPAAPVAAPAEAALKRAEIPPPPPPPPVVVPDTAPAAQ